MSRLLPLLFLIPSCFIFSQTQIGDDIDGEATGDESGYSISLSADGSVVAIGAHLNDDNGTNSGHVRVYRNISGVWTQIGNDINGEATDDRSGCSVSLSADGSVVAIGAFLNDGNNANSGHVRIYENLSGVWTQIGNDIDGESVGDSSGWSVSLSDDGSILAIGAIYNDDGGAISGHVRIYENISGVWTKIGQDIPGETAGDESGFSVSLSANGSVVAIGATDNDANGSESGHVRVYENTSGVWIKAGQDIDGEAAGNLSGWSVSLSADGSVVAVGALLNSGSGSFSGHVRVYENISGVWTQIGSDIDGENNTDQSGCSVSLSADGSVVAIGARHNDGNGPGSGHVRVYENISGVWTQIGSDIDGEAANNLLGFSVSLSDDGSIVAIGAIRNAGNGPESGHVRVYDLSSTLSQNEESLSNFVLYPNPASNYVTVSLLNGMELKQINVYNNLGQFVSTSSKPTIDTSKLSSGLYSVEVITNKGKASKKLVIE